MNLPTTQTTTATTTKATLKPILKNVTIVLRPKNSETISAIVVTLTEWLLERNSVPQFLLREKSRIHQIFLRDNKDHLLNKILFISERDKYRSSDLIITLGGDGTLINICRKAPLNSPPIFGVNLGRLGFLTEFSTDNIFKNLNIVFQGESKFFSINLYLIRVYNEKKELKSKELFINDAVFTREHISRMFTLSLESSKQHIYNLFGDGLIISSPIGSTAYSLSAGGPITHPKVKAFILTPICPHGLTYRSMVISDKNRLTIHPTSDAKNVILTLDGQSVIPIQTGDTIVIRKHKNKFVKLIKNPTRNYYNTLKEKFFHGR
ncbi:MAG: NAD(+)/NADH kinase [Oligoflexia bacterium]|nr:NAD(+)/NADH kinase [Oligoflexia bacterium]